MGVKVLRPSGVDEFRAALQEAKAGDGPVVVHIETDPRSTVPDSQSWWDVPVSEVSEQPDVQKARKGYEKGLKKQRWFV